MILKIKKILKDKSFLVVFLIFIIGLFLRTLQLDKVPIGIVSDNVNFVLNGKSIFYTFHDISGLWNPLKFSPIPLEFPQAELPYLLFAPFVGPFPLSLFYAHIFPAVLNALFILLLYFICKKIIGIHEARIIACVAAINPWFILFGRSAYESPIALFFLFLFIAMLLSEYSWMKILSFVSLFFAFYTYSGYKIIILPFSFIAIFYSWYVNDKRKHTLQYLIIFLCVVFLHITFFIHLNNNLSSNRLSEISLYNNSQVIAQVNHERKLAIKTPYTNLFVNKATVIAKNTLSRYLGAFSFQYLFLTNEFSQRFTFWNHGYFYYIDCIFLIFGMCYIFWKKRSIFYFLFSLLLLAPLPSVFHFNDLSYSQRSSLLIPIVIVFIGSGIWYFIQIFRNKKIRYFFMCLIGIIYLLLVANFLNTYFFIYPITSSEGMNFSSRLAVSYIYRSKNISSHVFAIMKNPKNLYKDYLFYTNSYTRNNVLKVRNDVLQKSFNFENISFIPCEKVRAFEKDSTYIFDPGYHCKNIQVPSNLLSITQLADAGTIYNIVNDKICLHANLKRYPFNIKLKDFSVESLPTKNFCETYIINFQ